MDDVPWKTVVTTDTRTPQKLCETCEDSHFKNRAGAHVRNDMAIRNTHIAEVDTAIQEVVNVHDTDRYLCFKGLREWDQYHTRVEKIIMSDMYTGKLTKNIVKNLVVNVGLIQFKYRIGYRNVLKVYCTAPLFLYLVYQNLPLGPDYMR